jgi:hypothetical protein
MEGGIGILLIVLILVAAGVGVFLFVGARSAARQAPDDEGPNGKRATHRAPHPDQERREKGTAFPTDR